MALTDLDSAYLTDRGIDHQAAEESGMTCVILPGWKLPEGYDRESADLLIRLPAGYPDIAPDMWWFEPAISAADGSVIQATEVREVYLGREWQRWSRHLQPDQWRSGIDGLESYLALVIHDVKQWAKKP